MTIAEVAAALPVVTWWHVRREKVNGRATGRVTAQERERYGARRRLGEPVVIPGVVRDAKSLMYGGGSFTPATGPHAGETIYGGGCMGNNALQLLGQMIEREGIAAFPPEVARRPVRVAGLAFGKTDNDTELLFVPITLNGKRVAGLEKMVDAEWNRWYGVDCAEEFEDLREIEEPTLAGAKREARRIIAEVLHARKAGA